MRARDSRAVSTIRLILAALKDRDITERTKGNPAGLNDQQILAMLQSMIKQREESIKLYQKGGRHDLVEDEKAEIALIQTFLPPQLDETETEAVIDSLINEAGATSIKDTGRIMALLKERYAGSVDLSRAGALVRARLA
ncbi:MAG: GatB/YqeY domain-containing protein [Rhodospirillales bacterium]|nr:GatB/YqeY domain-containing protein [Rhodospirillales bacterium]